jgi:phosphoribosylaminoimidazolecarboxamide formyltransferase/IMP cyclohydrolase
VRDLDRSIGFSRDVVDLDVTERHEHFAFVSFGDHYHDLALQALGEDAAPPGRGVGLYHAAFEVPTRGALRATHERLVARDVAVTPVDHGISLALSFDDPDGNGLEVSLDTPPSATGGSGAGETSPSTRRRLSRRGRGTVLARERRTTTPFARGRPASDMRLAGMASNRGRNLINLADGLDDVEFAVVLTNDADAPVLEAAADRDVPTEVVERAPEEDRTAHEARVLDALGGYGFDLICLDGYMRILTDEFVDRTATILNVHPSLLPAFPGLDAHEQVLDAGARVTGCTVHVVDETVDGGPIVTQEPVPVYADDDAAALKRRVLHEAEFRAYPRAVQWFAEDRVTVDREAGTVHVEGDDDGAFPDRHVTGTDRAATLRYGETPHQDAALYADRTCEEAGVVGAPQLNEGARALSYNNYNDADAALDLVKEFDRPAAAVIKHTNPAGCATADSVAEAYDRALATDAMSAFGGIVALNRRCDAATADRITDSFKEVVVAPDYTDDALAVLGDSENLRVLAVGAFGDREHGADAPTERFTEKPLVGGRLIQERDLADVGRDDLEIVTEREPTGEQIESMLFAWRTIKHVKSNAIVFADGTETVGVGMGQVSRVDAVRLAAMKAEEHAEGKDAEGAVMASDAFFPFPDGVERAAEAGIEAVIQPGGSKNDENVIAAADEHDVAMAFTGQRAFRHD